MGFVLLGLGIYLRVEDGKPFGKLVETGTRTVLAGDTADDSTNGTSFYGTAAAVTMIIISLIVVIVAAFGCCGTLKVRSRSSNVVLYSESLTLPKPTIII